MSESEMIPVERLLCSQIIFRHGTRTPLHLLPLGKQDVISSESRSEKYGLKNVFYGPDLFHSHPPSEAVKITLDKSKGPSTKCRRDYLISIGVDPDVKLKGGADYGMLTSQGRKQLYNLGQKIAEMLSAYPEFMQALPLRKNLWVQSSFDFRTLESAQSFLSGLYSKCKMTRINGFSEQAIEVPVHVESFEEDYMFPNCLATPILNRNVQKLYSFLSDDNPLKVMRTEFLKEQGVENYAYGLLELDDEPTCRKWLNLPMSPEMVEWHEKFLANVPREYNYIYGYKLSHEDFIKISSGRLLNLIVSNMKSHVNSDGPPFLYVFSAHDTTLHSLNIALGRKDTEWPRFASYMLFQLFSGKKGLYIKVTYNDQTISFDDETEPSFDTMMNLLNPLLCTNEEMLDINARLASESE